MKLSKLNLLSLLAATSLGFNAGCAPSTSTNTSEDFTDITAPFSGNVSETYALATISSAPGFDLKWVDSTGVRALSSYHGKVVLVTFWRTTDVGAGTILGSFDSVGRDLGDSVQVLMVDDDNSAARFTNAKTFVSAQQTKSQVLVDSAWRVHLRFAGDFSDGQLYYTETFVVKPDGNVIKDAGVIANLPSSHEGTRALMDSVVRAAYR